jgi:hypothetical protein
MAKDIFKEEAAKQKRKADAKNQKIHVVPGGWNPTIREPWEMSIQFHNDDARNLDKKLKPIRMKDLTEDYAASISNNINKLKYPALATPKVEGVRCLTLGDGVAVDGDKHKIPNKMIYNTLKEYRMGGLDGGLTIPEATEEEIYSAVMNPNAVENFKYLVFDLWNRLLVRYEDRVKALDFVLAKPRPPMIEIIKPVVITASGGVLPFYKEAAKLGYDGIVVQDPDGAYAYIDDESPTTYKLKLYQEGQGEIIAANESSKNPGTLESFRLKDFEFKYEFNVKRGYTKDQRVSFWNLRKQYMGGQLFYKTHAGLTIIPPHPSFVRIEV